MIKLTSFSDAGHGWLSCKIELINQLGLADKITRFSYINGKSVYLEEDCDAETLIVKLHELKMPFKIVAGKWQQYSRIRNFKPYQFRGEK